MADPSIDIQCQAILPNSNSNVFVQLTESRPEEVYYRINLRDPQSNVTHVVPPGIYVLPQPHDLQRSANALRGFKVACVGTVGFKVAGPWNLALQIIVDGNVIKECPGSLNGTLGTMSMFRFICDLT